MGEQTDKSEFGGTGRSGRSGDVILNRERSPDGEETDKSEFAGAARQRKIG